MTVDLDALQAQYFISELESVAAILVDEIDTIHALMGGRREADRRVAELYRIRAFIDALRRRFATAA